MMTKTKALLIALVGVWLGISMAVAEPEQPADIHPFYVETIATFNSAVSGVPQFVIDNPKEVRTLKVHGERGSTRLIADAESDLTGCQGHWNGTIRHDDGTYAIYSVESVDPESRQIVIYPPLRKAATKGQLSNTYDADRGQHYTDVGYYALARHIYGYGRETAYRESFIFRDNVDSENSAWTTSGGWFGPAHRLNTFSYRHPQGTFFHSTAISTRHFSASPGNRMTMNVELEGKSGYLETTVGLAGGLGPIHVAVTIDGQTVYDNQKIIGLERITVPFTAARAGSIEIVAGGEAASQIRVGATTWWSYGDPDRYRNRPLFPADSKVVLYGDSWGVFYDSALFRELQSLLKQDNSTIVNSSVGGKTAAWAIENFDERVLAHDPDIVIVEFFTNDHNQVDFATWKANIRDLCKLAISHGITPIVILPAPTASISQAQEHIRWNGEFVNIDY